MTLNDTQAIWTMARHNEVKVIPYSRHAYECGGGESDWVKKSLQEGIQVLVGCLGGAHFQRQVLPIVLSKRRAMIGSCFP